MTHSNGSYHVWVCPQHGQRNYPTGSVGQCGAAVHVPGQPPLVRIYCQHTLTKMAVVAVDELAEPLAVFYGEHPLTIAKLCDEYLDRSGRLLGKVRATSRAALPGRDGS